MRTLKLIAAAAGLSLVSSLAAAQDFDGSKPLLCASGEVHECGPGSDCSRGSVEDFNVPRFLRVDFAGKQIKATRPDGEERTTEIKSMIQEEGELVLQGVQGGLAWSLAIAKETGGMALSASGERVVFAIFGACTPL